MTLLAPETAAATPAQTTPDARAAFAAALQRVDDAFAVALKQAEERLAALGAEHDALTKEHATLAAEHQELKQRHAEAETKIAVLQELKAKLASL